MCEFTLQCRLLDDLQGTTCQNANCEENSLAWAAWSTSNTLGPMRARSDAHGITTKTAWYKCGCCRRAHTVHLDNPLYSLRDRLDEATYAWWMFVHGATLTLTALHMGRKEDVVRRYFHHAAMICAHDAAFRQTCLVFGHRFPFTTLCEADEIRIGKFTVTIHGVQDFYHLILLGVCARGAPGHVWLVLVGLTRSAEKSRVPQLKHYIWKMVCNTLFDNGSHMINMTDGAGAYNVPHEGVLEHHAVNHQANEWTRPADATFNLETGEKRATLASTNYLDSQWQKIKEQMPRGLSVTTAGGIRTKMRSAQWRMMIRGEDRWQAFCEAAVTWRSERADLEAEMEIDPTCVDEIEDEASDEEPDGIVVEQDGQRPVPFGFEATGELALLQKERRVRAEFGQQIAADDHGNVWDEADKDSEATEVYEADEAGGVEHFSDEEVAADPDEEVPERPDEEMLKRDMDCKLWGDRYFESQEYMKCGRHAINNLFGGPQLINQDLENASSEVCAVTLDHKLLHIAPNGWYSHSVLATLFDMTSPPVARLLLRPADESAYHSMLDTDAYWGCLINQRNAHWVCVAKENSTLFYLDSYHAPVTIHFSDFQSILRKYPMSFFVEKHK
jgi:hypothetical protein